MELKNVGTGRSDKKAMLTFHKYVLNAHTSCAFNIIGSEDMERGSQSELLDSHFSLAIWNNELCVSIEWSWLYRQAQLLDLDLPEV